MPVTTRKIPNEIKELIDHLRASGTGQSKLDKITAVALKARNADEFLNSVRLNVPPGTWVKVQQFLSERGVDVDSIVTAKEAEGEISSRSEMQSSIPEITFTRQREAATIGEVVAPGVVKARQDGADRVLTDQAKGEAGGEGGDDGEQSELASLNANEAKDAISRMRSKEKLQHIANTDGRSTVKEAAQKRLEELK